ncbi:MAG: hypothetical protein ACOYNN_14575, partial [Terrimicrobiaceae bacterium]
GKFNTYADTALYLKMVEYFHREYSESTIFKVQYTEAAFGAIEKQNGDFVVVKSSNMHFHVADGSYFIIRPKGKNVEISTFFVANKGKGLGTHLMKIILTAWTNAIVEVEESQHGTLVLDCTGSIMINGELVNNPIGRQIHFFSKFGFEVDKVVDEPIKGFGWVKMKMTNYQIVLRVVQKYIANIQEYA